MAVSISGFISYCFHGFYITYFCINFSYCPRKRVLSLILPFDEDELEDRDHYRSDYISKNPNDYESFGRDIWIRIVSVFEDENLHVLTIDFWAYTILRIITGLFIIFLVFPLGLITAGWLW